MTETEQLPLWQRRAAEFGITAEKARKTLHTPAPRRTSGAPPYRTNPERFEEGNEYGRWVCKKWGEVYRDPLHYYETANEQKHVGETAEGVEIKNDELIDQFGRLYIECAAEGLDGVNMYPGGIWRRDNSWLYCIGDLHTWWVFDIEALRMVFRREMPRYCRYIPQVHWCFDMTPNRRSKGFCLYLDDADWLCLDRKDFDDHRKAEATYPWNGSRERQIHFESGFDVEKYRTLARLVDADNWVIPRKIRPRQNWCQGSISPRAAGYLPGH